MSIHEKFTDVRPVYTQEQAAIDNTFILYACVSIGFMAGVAFMLMSARMGFLDALSAGGVL